MRAAHQSQQAVSQPTMVIAVSPLAMRGGAAAAAAVLPSINTLAAASVLPTLLGLWRTGYAVSYAYGGAVAACAALTLPALSGIARWHALALIFYGVRLNAHLFYRECALPREISGMKAKDATLAERLKRAMEQEGAPSLRRTRSAMHGKAPSEWSTGKRECKRAMASNPFLQSSS